MALLLQLNGELPDRFPGHDRRLYVFSCRKKGCRRKEGTMRALRSIRVTAQAEAARKAEAEKSAPVQQQPKQPPKLGFGLGESLFGVQQGIGGGSASGSPNPFALSSSANPFSVSTSANPFSMSTSATPFSATGQPKAPAATPPSPPSADTSEDPALHKTFAEALSLNSDSSPQQQAASPSLPLGPPPPLESWPEKEESPAYPVRWIAEADYETLDPTPLPRVPTKTTMDLDDEAAGGSSRKGGGGGGKEDKEVFESSMDSTFQKFADRVGQNPEQVIRYEFAGQPLLYSKDDAVGKRLAAAGGPLAGVGVSVSRGMPPCRNCGAARVFEVQMTPHAIAELETDVDDLDGMDWGTVIVGVCERDCQERGVAPGEVGYVEEWAGVQWEELSANR